LEYGTRSTAKQTSDRPLAARLAGEAIQEVLLVFAAGVYRAGGFGSIVADQKDNRLAADFAVFYVLVTGGGWINQGSESLGAVGALDEVFFQFHHCSIVPVGEKK
jgi:hypothetical protein